MKLLSVWKSMGELGSDKVYPAVPPGWLSPPSRGPPGPAQPAATDGPRRPLFAGRHPHPLPPHPVPYPIPVPPPQIGPDGLNLRLLLDPTDFMNACCA